MHTKAQLQKLSKARLVSLLMFLLAITKKKAPKEYREVENRAHIRASKSRKRKRKKGKRNKRSGKKMSPKLKRFLKSHGRFPRKGELK